MASSRSRPPSAVGPGPHVPVTMGAREARSRDAGPFHLIDARFPAGERLDRHTHERATFMVMLRGSFDLLIGGRRFHCPAGTVCTEPAGETHANAIGSGGAHVMVAQPDPAADFPAPCRRLLDGINHFDSPAIVRIGRRLARELRDPDELTPLESQALAFEMLVVAGRMEMASARAGDPPAWFRRVEEIVHDRYREPIRIEELAGEAGVHAAHLTRVFRERYGTSPGRYLRRLRLEWAAHQLVTGEEPLSGVALDAGFADQAHFTRAFRRHWGISPGRYRTLRRR